LIGGRRELIPAYTPPYGGASSLDDFATMSQSLIAILPSDRLRSQEAASQIAIADVATPSMEGNCPAVSA
jgi:hypothetical protein